ncbi:MAG: hypothetical protein L0Y44_00080 [Phycisphaerales bacterium]|nr:hypothetical protein [Phycisphaerales bacterium]MCI0629035.1 hypothetical protein [Phycisphaerales bacterium]MCI0674792.1 hypothetical protein [Phycisphaerales bacterium]
MDDTHPNARRVQTELLRACTPERRLAMALELTDWVLQVSRRAIASARPDLSPQEQSLLFVEIHYGRELADRLRSNLKSRKGS